MVVGARICRTNEFVATHKIIEFRYGQGDVYATVQNLRSGMVEREGIPSQELHTEWKVEP
jgi:hypothetical protein